MSPSKSVQRKEDTPGSVVDTEGAQERILCFHIGVALIFG